MRGIAVGVDAGGSVTSAAYSRDGVFEREIASVAANASSVGSALASERIEAAVRELLGELRADVVYVGAAGAGSQSIASAIASALEKELSARVVVTDDAHIALRAGVPTGDGAVLIAGTGSIAYAQHGGDTYRCGGLGYVLGDEGSGFALGLSAAKLLGRVYDERAAADELTRAVEEELGVSNREELVRLLYSGSMQSLLATLAIPVLTLAGDGVRSAHKIVQGAALELADLVKAVVRIAQFGESAFPLVLCGGLLSQNTLLSFLLETRVQNDLPNAEIIKGNIDPVRGALAAAEALLGG